MFNAELQVGLSITRISCR